MAKNARDAFYPLICVNHILPVIPKFVCLKNWNPRAAAVYLNYVYLENVVSLEIPLFQTFLKIPIGNSYLFSFI